jgi:SAM-dependent methyltransferase
MGLTETDIVSRYRENYGLSTDISLSDIERHKQLEADLTNKLLNSTAENRWQTFHNCYSTLYESLPWLNVAGAGQSKARYDAWAALIKTPSRVFEVGSGAGHLIRHLAALGHQCAATEITAERGKKHISDIAGIEWRITDGVNLAKFEQREAYDVVISSQVIEHLHPDDVLCHFENVLLILKPEGKYIFDTPHVGTGPHDLSKVFGLARPAFMHLREYDYRELGRIAKLAGFREIQAVLFYESGRITIGPYSSHLLFLYYCFVDSVISALRISPARERSLRRFLRLALVPSGIWLVTQK